MTRPSEQVLREIEMAIASVLSKKPKLARTDLVQAVEKMAPVLGTFHGCEIEKDSCAMLIRRLEARLTVTLDLGSSVVSEFKPWLSAAKADIQPYYWDRYREYLAVKGFSEHVINSLDKITDRITDFGWGSEGRRAMAAARLGVGPRAVRKDSKLPWSD